MRALAKLARRILGLPPIRWGLAPFRWFAATTAGRRFSILPFESLVGGVVALSGALGLIRVGGVGTDALSLLLPGWLLALVNVLYLTSGVMLLAGLGFARADIEAFGLVTVAASTIIRTFALLTVAGLHGPVIVGLAYNVMVVWACVARLGTLARKEVIVSVRSRDSDE